MGSDAVGDAAGFALDDGGSFVRVTGTCSDAEQGLVNRYTSVAQLTERLIGRWQLCSGIGLSLDPGEYGIEFAADGSWYALLIPDGGSAPVRASGLSGQGTWDISTWTPASPGWGLGVQLDIHHAQGGDGCSFPAFAVTPTKLDCNTSAAGPHVYVAIP